MSSERAHFKLRSEFTPKGDQPQAIAALCKGLDENRRYQALLGITGSGKTFTIANVIQHYQRPTLIIAPNKTLAAQLYAEMRDLFPESAVAFFVSYYDYYQPEAYIPTTDTFIEKDRSEEHTSELQSQSNLVCRLLLEKKNNNKV